MREIVCIDINQTEVIVVNDDGRVSSFKQSNFLSIFEFSYNF